MEPESSLPHSQVPATCPYPEPDRSSPCPPPIPLPERPSSYYRPLYTLVFQVVSFLQVSPIKTLYKPLLPPTCYMPRPSLRMSYFFYKKLLFTVRLQNYVNHRIIRFHCQSRRTYVNLSSVKLHFKISYSHCFSHFSCVYTISSIAVVIN